MAILPKDQRRGVIFKGENNLVLFLKGVSTRGDSAPWGQGVTSGDICHCHAGGGGVLALSGWGQGCYSTPPSAQDGPPQTRPQCQQCDVCQHCQGERPWSISELKL